MVIGLPYIRIRSLDTFSKETFRYRKWKRLTWTAKWGKRIVFRLNAVCLGFSQKSGLNNCLCLPAESVHSVAVQLSVGAVFFIDCRCQGKVWSATCTASTALRFLLVWLKWAFSVWEMDVCSSQKKGFFSKTTHIGFQSVNVECSCVNRCVQHCCPKSGIVDEGCYLKPDQKHLPVHVSLKHNGHEILNCRLLIWIVWKWNYEMWFSINRYFCRRNSVRLRKLCVNFVCIKRNLWSLIE